MRGDTELLDAWASGDAAAGREFYGRFADRVARFFTRKTRDDAADLVQNTFLKCLDARKRGREVTDAAALLFAVARNELFDHLRRRMRDARFEPEETSLEDAGLRASEILARHEEQRLLLGALQRIPIDYQLAVELYYWEELSMEAVAEVLGVTRSAAINKVHRAREMIRERLGAAAERPELALHTMTGFETWARSLKS